MVKIISVVGARPNFIKIAPLNKEFMNYPQIRNYICHTGQHFDEKMSDIFFRELEISKPDFNLGIGSGTHAAQTASIMIEFEKVIDLVKPDLVIVPGDVNSTMACTLVASKKNIPVAHIESGLRSFDRTMPEEINRIVTDVLSEYLFVTEESGIRNLKNEGISPAKIFFVGNIMIDSLINYLPKIDGSDIEKRLNIAEEKYCLCTFHRPSNVDDPRNLAEILDMLKELSGKLSVIFPMHPRTRNVFNLIKKSPQEYANIIITDPIGYIDFLSLLKNSELVITDSGGIQEETTFLGVQCLTVRNNTERPVTAEIGTNQLIGSDFGKIKTAALEILSGKIKEGRIPELWDGKAAKRIASIIASDFIPVKKKDKDLF
jgi:UDP-N-acetylglucosamine 2-epimerase (non-hydrolysing)